MNLSTLVVAGVLTGTSFLNGADRPGEPEEPGTVTTPAATSVSEPAAERRAARCRDQEPTSWDIKVAGEDEPGERLVVEGRVLGLDRVPLAGIKVYVRHADASGALESHGEPGAPRLCGVLRTDERGRYRVTTVRPARPHHGGPPQVHYEVMAPGRSTESFVLTLETRPAAKMSETWAARRPIERDPHGVWHCRRDLVVRR
jgi:protocatechuate 3,4-dioxygenase beta subunit